MPSMNYSDSIELSTRLLKQAIVLMARQAAALHPISYAVWYEYVAGTNPGLNSEIERLTANGGHLDELQTLDLYSRFIGGLRQEEAKQLQERFLEILKQMSHSAAEVDRRATAYGTVLEDFGSELATASSANAAQAGIDWVLSQTREMQASVQVLKESLDHSKQEAENLRAELFKARREAQVDALTGLTNRRGLDDVLRERIAEASPETAGLSVAVLDLDHFKSVNDTYGHPFGDRVIQSVAEIIRSNIKGKDTAARFGGEEFVLVMPDTPLDGARWLAEQIRVGVARCVVKRVDSDESVGNFSISIGVTRLHPGDTPESLVQRADEALYVSKKRGRNCVTVLQ